MDWVLYVILVVVGLAASLKLLYMQKQLISIESKLDEQALQMRKLLNVLSSDNSPNLPSFEDVRGILKRKDGDDG